ncbi:HET-domain-containing protein [Karstenula rhodostoma CBS 690.94]|uniref:HET-domain-containing protein n=1 Tax=Karstenula rhodostoma CBS 690.94 TaxID=1392251 RepID=A0A9P4PYW4_9PLEO|nr:HET-domain-containing protein [Karstenula rhodostoma CBS 690.94]
MEYTYKPLSDAGAEIRVAVIQPGAYDDDIYISFRTRHLQRESELAVMEDSGFDFEALSYAWGLPEHVSRVQVVDKDTGATVGNIEIGQNLDVALRNIRLEHEERFMWIDAICINQKDDEEKGTQVAMMGDVFSRASCVTAWLGREENNSSMAIQLLQDLTFHVEFGNHFTMRPTLGTSHSHWADQKIPLPFRTGELDSVCALFQRPYFDRTWIRQEIVLATNACVQCGQQRIPWEDFRNAATCLRVKSYFSAGLSSYNSQLYIVRRKLVFLLCNISPHSLWLRNLRYEFAGTQCEDPRDRLYAALSLLIPSDKALFTTPDYSRPARDIYITTALSFYTTFRSLELLNSCELSSRNLDLPSWVPDWSVPLRVSGRLSTNWSACAWISADVLVLESNRLRVSGIPVCRIEAVNNVIGGPRESRSGVSFSQLRDLREFLGFAQVSEEHKNTFLERCCWAFSDGFSESFLPPRGDRSSLDDCMKYLETVWSTEKSFDDIQDMFTLSVRECQAELVSDWQGRCIFKAGNDYIGLAPLGTRQGDIVCILLGCRYPVVLRAFQENQPDSTWQVFGPCRVPGIMSGEIIYGQKVSSLYRAVRRLEDTVQKSELIDGTPFALHNPVTGRVVTDPASVLEEAGIEVNDYQRRPHRLHVSPETLRRAGIPLQDFVLV